MFPLTLTQIAAGAALTLLPVAVLTSNLSEGWLDTENSRPARNRYIGAKACKNCHKAEAKGSQFQKWEKMGHAKAFAALASPEAKKKAAELKIEDPQKSPKCLKCHVTAYGLKKRMVKKGFDIKLGVQCESCHGPGERHAKIRFKEASAGKTDPNKHIKIPADEIIRRPEVKTCLGCHNKQSPTFKPFCFKHRQEKISHQDPRIKRTPEEIKAMKCKCGKDCKCNEADCGGWSDGKSDAKGSKPGKDD